MKEYVYILQARGGTFPMLVARNLSTVKDSLKMRSDGEIDINWKHNSARGKWEGQNPQTKTWWVIFEEELK